MKKILMFLLICISIFSLEINKEDLKYNRFEGIYYYKDIVFTGKTKEIFRGSTITQEYLNGKKHGEYKSVYKNNHIKEIGNYTNGNKEGLWAKYNPIMSEEIGKEAVQLEEYIPPKRTGQYYKKEYDIGGRYKIKFEKGELKKGNKIGLWITEKYKRDRQDNSLQSKYYEFYEDDKLVYRKKYTKFTDEIFVSFEDIKNNFYLNVEIDINYIKEIKDIDKFVEENNFEDIKKLTGLDENFIPNSVLENTDILYKNYKSMGIKINSIRNNNGSFSVDYKEKDVESIKFETIDPLTKEVSESRWNNK